MCIPNTALNNYSKLTETSVQRSPTDGIVNGPLQKRIIDYIIIYIYLSCEKEEVFELLPLSRYPPFASSLRAFDHTAPKR